ncbi:MAG: TetR/AcrR family transcriptional regulator [Myxococcales bacterium]|nr:TetR/AcrR family transcriptional regulator [Myxococcales bacterium]
MRHRQEILDAASALLEERGPEGLTMDEVAKRSEFAVGSIYRHFKSKDELVAAVIEDHLGPFFAQIQELSTAEGTFEELFDRFLAAYAKTVHDTRPVWRALLLLRNDGGNELHAVIPALESMIGYFDALEALIERGQADGVLIEEDPWILVGAIHGMLESFIKRSIFGLEVDFDAAIRVVRHAVLRGFRAGETS